MDLYEYQAKELFLKYNVPTTPGKVTASALDAKNIATEVNAPVMVKAQVKTGGRGKAGGVKYAENPQQAYEYAERILGLDINGHLVKKVLVAAASDIAEEYYISFLLDRAQRSYLAMCSAEGGVEIEEIASTRPDRLAKITIDPVVGVDIELAKEIARAGHLPETVISAAAETILKLWEVFIKEDAQLVEVNPLVRTPEDRILALDGKITLDDNAHFRHPNHEDFYDLSGENKLESQAKSLGLNYVKLDGEVGIIGNGAGLVMSTLDVVAYAGEKFGHIKPANFLDIGGGASAKIMSDGLSIILSDPQVKSVFVNVFGGITACDKVATGIVTALDILGAAAVKPIVVRLDGNSVQAGKDILVAANHPLVTVVDTMDAAAAKAAELANQ